MVQEDFLILCLAAETSHDRILHAAPRSPSAWVELVGRAKQSRVAPLLYHRLTSLPGGLAVPEEILERLRNAYFQCASSNARAYQELGAVLTSLRGAGVPVIALKGAHLAEIVYGNIALRPMVDIDLLLRETDVSRAKKLLLGSGFLGSGHDDHHIGLRRPGGGLFVEIHWSITCQNFPFHVETEALWDRSEPARIAGVDVTVLSPEDMTLHLCLHASYHHLFDTPLKYLCDIARVVLHYRERIDWGWLSSTARRRGLARCTYFTLWCTKRTLGCDVPEDVLRELQPPDLDPAWMESALHRLLRPERGRTAALTSANLSRLGATGRFREKIGILGRSLLPSRSTLARMYSVPADSFRIFLCYPVRWRDHFARHRGTAWRMLSRQRQTMDKARQENELRDWLSRPG